MHEAEEIRRRVLWWRENGDSMRYPTDLRRIITDYARRRVDGGVSVRRVGDETGMRKVTLSRWLKKEEEEAPGCTDLVPVRVATPSSAVAAGPAPGQRTVTSPTGWRIDGLALDEVLTLMREVS